MNKLNQINLNSLRIAESAARNGNFVLAAEEQLISASAVSQRIKSLEAQLRFRIFHRKNNSVQITPEGELFIVQVREALDKILMASTVREQRDQEKTINIQALPTFTVRWLMPRLPGFQALVPSVHMSVSNSYVMTDFDKEDIDVSICYGNGNFSNVKSTLLFPEDLTPVCSPEYYQRIFGKREGSDSDPEGLARCTLISSATCTLNWKSWLEFAGALSVYESAQSIEFDSCMMTFEAAASGVGVAVANRAYIIQDLKSGRLVAPFRVQQPNRNGWYLIHPTRTKLSSPSKIFRSWLLEQAQQTAKSIDDFLNA